MAVIAIWIHNNKEQAGSQLSKCREELVHVFTYHCMTGNLFTFFNIVTLPSFSLLFGIVLFEYYEWEIKYIAGIKNPGVSVIVLLFINDV